MQISLTKNVEILRVLFAVLKTGLRPYKAAGILSVLPVFWTLPTAFLTGASAAAGIALVNSIGNLAGFLSPYMVGLIKDATGNTTLALYVLAASMVLGAVLTFFVTRSKEQIFS